MTRFILRCARERRDFDSIGVGVTGAPHPWPFQATDVRSVPGGAPHDRLARRVRHRRAASVTRFMLRRPRERRDFDSIGVGVTGAPRP